MPRTRRTNLGRRTRNAAGQRRIRASQTVEEHEARNEVERNRWNQNQERRNVTFNPHRAAFNYNVAIDYSSQLIVAIGPMNIVCTHCKAFKFTNEAPGLCCANGKVKLSTLVPPPEPLRSLISGNGPDSKHFLTNIQQYNSCFQMTSFGATKVIRDNFMPTFKVSNETGNCYKHVVSAKYIVSFQSTLCKLHWYLQMPKATRNECVTEEPDQVMAVLATYFAGHMALQTFRPTIIYITITSIYHCRFRVKYIIGQVPYCQCRIAITNFCKFISWAIQQDKSISVVHTMLQ